MQIVCDSSGHMEWGLVLAVVFVVMGIGNLVTLYTLARFFRQQERKRQRDRDKGAARDRDQGRGED